jgi:hypothetical protein
LFCRSFFSFNCEFIDSDLERKILVTKELIGPSEENKKLLEIQENLEFIKYDNLN